jgi:hypothetical protein
LYQPDPSKVDARMIERAASRGGSQGRLWWCRRLALVFVDACPSLEKPNLAITYSRLFLKCEQEKDRPTETCATVPVSRADSLV